MKKRILISEDDRNLANMLKEILEKENYDVEVSYDGISTLNLLLSFKPHLLISDIMMPQEDGHHICKKIIEDPIYHPIPKIIVITIRRDEWNRKLSEFIGVDAFIQKPFSPEILIQKVEELIGDAEDIDKR